MTETPECDLDSVIDRLLEGSYTQLWPARSSRWKLQHSRGFCSCYFRHSPLEWSFANNFLVRGTRPGKQVQLAEYEIKYLCTKAREIFINQPILLELEAPIKICGTWLSCSSLSTNIPGDIHGQYYDLLRLFEYGGFPPEANYLFLGDYVDRGKQSLETICLLLAYKIKYSENFFILRGNHECASINRIYGFYDECGYRHGLQSYLTV